MTDDDRAWQDPPLDGARERRRVRVRLLCSAVVFLAFVALSWDHAFEVFDRLWPPRGSLSRWFTLVLLQLMGYVVLPLLIGGFLGDVVYDRFLQE